MIFLLASCPALSDQILSQITQPLSRSALSEGGVTALMSRAGNVTTVVTPVTLRSSPVTIPSRHHSSSSSLLEDDIGAGDYITLTSTNPALVFSSHQDRGESSHQDSISLISLIPCRSPTGLDNSGHRPRSGGGRVH